MCHVIQRTMPNLVCGLNEIGFSWSNPSAPKRASVPKGNKGTSVSGCTVAAVASAAASESSSTAEKSSSIAKKSNGQKGDIAKKRGRRNRDQDVTNTASPQSNTKSTSPESEEKEDLPAGKKHISSVV